MRRNRAAAGCRRVVLGIVAFCSSAMATGPASAAEVQGGSFSTSDGVKIHYLEAGKGPAIVFVPGWSMPAWIWESQIKHFSENFHVLALDPRSQGESEKVANGNDMERRARDVKELVEHLHLAPAVLVGWSLAVPELLSYAEQFGGDSVRGYVLVDGFAWTKQDLQFVASMLAMYHQVEANRAVFTDRFVRSMYRKPQPEEYIERVKQASMQMPADSAVAASVSSVSRADFTAAIRKMDKPVMVICETQLKAMAADPIAALIPTARVELFEDAGHALFVDDADRFNTVLEDFIAHLAGSRR